MKKLFGLLPVFLCVFRRSAAITWGWASATNTVSLSVGANNGSVFYRLIYP